MGEQTQQQALAPQPEPPPAQRPWGRWGRLLAAMGGVAVIATLVAVGLDAGRSSTAASVSLPCA